MVINPGEPVSRTGRNNNDVAGLELIALSIANRRGIIAWSIDEAHNRIIRRASLFVDEIGTKNKCPRSVDDMVHLTDLIMFSNRIWQRRIELSAMHKADGDSCFADVDIAHLLINPSFGDRLFKYSDSSFTEMYVPGQFAQVGSGPSLCAAWHDMTQHAIPIPTTMFLMCSSSAY